MKRIVRLTESDLVNLVKSVLNENDINPQNNHRYQESSTEPGIEKFLENPTDQVIENGIISQLERDKYGKGKIVIIFNNRRFDRPTEFVYFIQEAFENGICYKITNYEYKNRSTAGVDLGIRNTKITILAQQKECKKNEEPIVGGTTTGGTKPPQRRDKPKRKCRYSLIQTKPEGWRDGGQAEKAFQRKCLNQGIYVAQFDNGETVKCGSAMIDGLWGCCSASCYAKNDKLYPNPGNNYGQY